MIHDLATHPSLDPSPKGFGTFADSSTPVTALNYDSSTGLYRGDDFVIGLSEPAGTGYCAAPKFAKEAKSAADRATLREWLNTKDTEKPRLFTDLRWRSSSGMSRSIGVLLPYVDERTGIVGIRNLSRVAARVLGWKLDSEREAVRVQGAGMDMGFHLVYSLSSAVYRADWSCTNRRALEAATNNDPGYVIRHEWI